MDPFIENLIDNQQFFISIIIALLLLLIISTSIYILAQHQEKQQKLFLSILLYNERWPIAIICSLVFLYLLFPYNLFTSAEVIEKIFVIVIIFAFTWFFIKLVEVIKQLIFKYYSIEKADNLHERKIRTQFQYIRAVLLIIIIITGIAMILWQFEELRIIGTGLLASMGIIAIIIAFTANQALSNLLAGLQIAFTQPFRIDDVVIVEGEWGRIEEITMTYVVVRIWDQRRLVLPITYFTTTPFQNWTRTTAEILGTVMIYVDYSVPIEEVRKELERIVHSTELWDGRLVKLQVTDASEKTITLRALVSAKDASDAWDLRCYVRERLIEFLQKKYPNTLPQIRLKGKLMD